ncbi:hypothetical protein ACFXJO_29130 [Streptomyces lavendulae]|uniref:hypothetical protein n=1 Tax=Streptomyces lavendulae TaxID=1914 RepID=UPI0036CB1823
MRIPSLLELGPEQQDVIDLPFQGSHVVTGPPGGGKTVMAVYRTWALAAAGRDVVLVTRFNLLRQYIAQLAPELTDAIGITTWERWIAALWRARFRTDPPRCAEDSLSYDWFEMQRNCVVQGVGAKIHLVIDEGQNLPLGFYQLCRILGIEVTVFADENQRISDEQSTLSEIRRTLTPASEPLVLPANYRNSREIAMLASGFRVEGREEIPLSEPSGRTPVVMRVPSLDALATGISQYVSAHPGWTIGIICRSILMMRDIRRRLSTLGLARRTQTYFHDSHERDTIDFSTHPIKIVSTASMKGLEFDSVFVPDLDSYTEDPTSVEARLRFLVLCTRARKDIHFAHRDSEEPAILSDVPDSLLLRHSG